MCNTKSTFVTFSIFILLFADYTSNTLLNNNLFKNVNLKFYNLELILMILVKDYKRETAQ